MIREPSAAGRPEVDATEMLVERTVPGEPLGASAARSNLRGWPHLRYDGAGVVQNVAFDSKGNLLERVDVRVRGAQSWTAFVDDIDYDAKGQREQIVYDSGATRTEYTRGGQLVHADSAE